MDAKQLEQEILATLMRNVGVYLNDKALPETQTYVVTRRDLSAVLEHAAANLAMMYADRIDPPAPEVTVDAALSALRREYYTDVRSYAEELAREHVDPETRECNDEDALSDALHETCDGSQWVIYTARAKRGLLCSDNEEAIEDEGLGMENPTSEQRMYFALRADIQELLSNEYFLQDIFPEASDDAE